MTGRRGATKRIAAIALAVTATAVATGPVTGAAPSAGHGYASIAFTRDDTLDTHVTDPFDPPGATALVGDFAGDTTAQGRLDDILWYTPGSGGDALWRTRGDRSWAEVNVSVNGRYTPLVGRFSGDGKEDVFWYAPGSTPDVLWDFEVDGTITQTTYTVSGTYTPVVGHFSSDDGDDIVWYAPGRGADSWWDFDGHGRVAKRSLTVNGTYTPVVGSFSGIGAPTNDTAQDILWYGKGSVADSIWDFNGDGAATAKRGISIGGSYTPVPGDFSHDGFTDVIWYTPGSGPDSMWNFTNTSGAHTTIPLSINGTYTPVTGELFEQDGHQTDVLWFGAGGSRDVIWDFTAGTTPTSRDLTLVGDQTPVLGVFERQVVGGTTRQGADILDRHT